MYSYVTVSLPEGTYSACFVWRCQSSTRFFLCQKMTSIAQLAGFLSPNWQHLCLRNFLTTVRAAQLTGITCRFWLKRLLFFGPGVVLEHISSPEVPTVPLKIQPGENKSTKAVSCIGHHPTRTIEKKTWSNDPSTKSYNIVADSSKFFLSGAWKSLFDCALCKPIFFSHAALGAMQTTNDKMQPSKQSWFEINITWGWYRMM